MTSDHANRAASPRPLCFILSPFRGIIPDYLDKPVDDSEQAQKDWRDSVKWSRLNSQRDNVAYAKRALKDSLDRGECPFASHLLYPQALDDNKSDERNIGLECEQTWFGTAIDACKGLEKEVILAVYTDRGLSPGMKQMIEYAVNSSYCVKLEFRSLPDKPDIDDTVPF